MDENNENRQSEKMSKGCEDMAVVSLHEEPAKLNVMANIRKLMQEGMQKKGITPEQAIKASGIRRNEK